LGKLCRYFAIVDATIDRMSHEIPPQLGIDVTAVVHNNEHAIAARVYCKRDNCGKDITLVSDGPDTQQFVECPVHGEIASFQNFDEYDRTVKFVINTVNEAKGLPLIDPNAKGRIQQDS